MIHFKSIRWSNFLSTGANPIEIQLDKNPTTLIVGTNGSGKSTLLDALSYALFGKPHRDIKKAQLVNSINNKKMLVECEFSIGSHNFRVVRGLKPARFEIYQDDRLINQNSDARDYQKFLETTILRLNHKSFHQIVVIGASSFVPFMQLPTRHRREVIDDLLDIRVITTMAGMAKENLSRIRELLRDNKYMIDSLESQIHMQQEHIRNIVKMTDDQVVYKQQSINQLEQERAELNEGYEDEKTAVAQETNFVEYEINEQQKVEKRLNDAIAQYKQEIKSLVRETKFYQENDTCPTCAQEIDADTKHQKYHQSSTRAKVLKEGIDEAETRLSDVKAKLSQLAQDQNKALDRKRALLDRAREANYKTHRINELRHEINQIQQSGNDVDKANDKLAELRQQHTDVVSRRAQLNEDQTYYTAAHEMLKDTGIKTKIIKQYLPVMNQLVNYYLQVLDFFVSFHLDESFTEEIRSRHRDSFNYASFSEGEKQRIDLALLFTWRKIAAMKNSASTNLLIMDEVFDSSLDDEGIENLMKILDAVEEGTNVWIISHKGDVLESKFANKIEVSKNQNFSEVRYND